MTASTPVTSSPYRSTMSRSTPWVDGWFGPKLIVRTSPVAIISGVVVSTVGVGLGTRVPR